MSLGDAAAKLRLPVFPCNKDKKPIVKGGFYAATTDRQAILAAFANPGAKMIGMPTGQTTGTAVIDVDVKDGKRGDEWLQANAATLPQTRTHRTATGGLHLIFRYPAGYDVPSTVEHIAPGVDVRANGGYLVIPPTPGYVIADPTEPADMPEWLIRACLKPEPVPQPAPAAPAVRRTEGGSHYGLAALRDECDAIRRAPWGQQEHTLNAAALKIGALVAGGELSEGIALGDLLAAGRSMASQPGRPAWRDAEIEAKVRRAFADGQRSPRQAPADERKQRPTASAEPPPHLNTDPAQEADMEREAEERANAEPGQDAGEQGAKTNGQAKEEKQPRPDLPLVFWEDMERKTETLDFVEGLLDEGSSAVLYGESNSGKTFFATDLALHVASGLTWRDRDVTQGGVVYCALEGSRGFFNRIAAWKEARSEGRIPFAAVTVAVDLLHPAADTGRLVKAVQTAQARFEMPVKLIVVDTLSRAMAGGDENASEDMGALVMNMDRIRAETGACVLFVHHSGKDSSKGARGHSILRAAIETEIEVAPIEGSKQRVATVRKQREMECVGTFGFELEVVDLGDNQRGKTVTSCVVRHVDDESVPTQAKLTGDVQTAYAVLCDLLAETGKLHPTVPNGLMSTLEDWWKERFEERAKPGAKPDAKRKAFERAAKKLVETRRVGLNKGRVWLVRD